MEVFRKSPLSGWTGYGPIMGYGKIFFSIVIAFLFFDLHSQVNLKTDSMIEERVKQTLKKNAEILRFMENKGQLENRNILYYFEGKKTAVYIERTKIRFVAKDYEIIKHNQKFLEDEIILKGTHTFTLNFNGANPQPSIKLGDSFSTHYNYFNGNNSQTWASNVRAAKDLTLENIYPGIDIRLYSSADGELEFDWILDAGADYKKINLILEGQDKLSVDEKGNLNLGLRFTDIKFHIPESYQVTDHGKSPVEFAFEANGHNSIGFSTKSKIDTRYPLIIDPILTWGTFFDGNDTDFDQYLFAIQVDSIDGKVYCAGASNRQISTSAAPYDANGYLNVITGFTTGATPRVAIIYRLSSSGSDLVDLTLYGPNSVAAGDQVAAYGLSLSNNRVFVCGRTTIDVPTTGSPFDGTRNGNDGFVAIFSKDLGTLHYATYLGSTGAEDLGAPSIRAVDDNTYVVGFTTLAALPAAYITSGVADATYGGSSEMWIGKFSSTNTLTWGTYIGGSEEETFNDLEVFPDGRVAFAGWGNNTTAGMTEVNGAAAGSNSNSDIDGIMGVLNSTATAFNYLDEIGGSGTDKINDVELLNGTLAWTGSVSSGFPTSTGAYDVSHNGGTDAAVGTVSATGGAASYKCTFFGGGGDDIGEGIKTITQYNCAGTQVIYLMVFGTTDANATGIPTVNINGESFYQASNQGGLDMFFAAFNESISSLRFATNMGGAYNDYLGDTGDPRGSNHLSLKDGNIYVGTTTHSGSHSPLIIGGTGFDQTKSNTANPTTDDAHIIFSIEYTIIPETDYSDAPASYGSPSHILDCTHLKINTLDGDNTGAMPTANASGDDAYISDDEDGVSSFPTLTTGGPQTISVPVTNILNTTGRTANLYAWIDLNGNGAFEASEIQSTTVADGFSGTKTLVWTGVTVSGSLSAHYLRIRLTTNNLNDDSVSSGVDERSTSTASNGEVEDYLLVTLNCPTAQTESSCQTQASINTKYATWLATVTAGGGCSGSLSNNGSVNPSACGEAKTVTFTYTSSCAPASTTCSSVFTVNALASVVLNCASNVTEVACQTQAAIDTKYANWLATVTTSGGCNSSLSNNSTGAPSACGGSKTVVFTVTSSCQSNVTCSASFTVSSSSVVLNCPSNVTEASCQTQAAIDTKYANWLATVATSGGCNSSLTNNSTGAPSACGGSKTVVFTVTSSCQANVTCSASFTVTAAPAVSLTCPLNVTETSCQTQAVIDTKYANWLAIVTTSGGCNSSLTNNSTGAPSACGGSKTVVFTVTSSCQANVTCSASFTVTAAPAVSLTCPLNVTETSCQTQAAIDTKYANWLATVTTSGGCNLSLTNNSTGAPSACGGSKTVVFTVTSSCQANVTCSATFTVTAAPAVSLTCPLNVTETSCQTQAVIDTKYANWLATVATSGGCNSSLTNNSSGAPSACGGSKTVVFTVTSSCQTDVTCSASFTVTVAPTVSLTCPLNVTETSCQTQAAIDTKYANWLATVATSGGCNSSLTNNSSGAPSACGGSKTVVFTVTSSCQTDVTCSASFTVNAALAVSLTCPLNVTETSCQTQAAIDTKYANWLATVTTSGGCNSSLTNNSTGAPSACGGSKTVVFTVTSSCQADVTCSASFTVTVAPSVSLTCPLNVTEASCQTQAAIDTKYANWLATVTTSGGCNSSLTNNSTGAPSACGGSKTVLFTVTSSCQTDVTCSASFTVTAAPAVSLTCPLNVTEASCQTQATIDTKYANWLATVTTSGGCNSSLTNNSTGAPSACGGSKTVVFTVTSSCQADVTCSASFTVNAEPAVSLTCPLNVTEASCQTQAAIDTKYANWLATVTISGGCNSSLTNNSSGAPSACGGSKTVVFTVTSSCQADVTCSASFTVNAEPAVSLTCPLNVTETSCQTQAAIDTKYANWLATVTTSGGCNSSLTNNSSGAPSACGGSKTVVFTVTSSCQADVTCSASFTVTSVPAVSLTCPLNVTEASCQTQAAIDTKYANWLATVTTSGGCNSSLINNSSGAPSACGGSKTAVFTVTSSCQADVTCSASFTVTAAPAVSLACPLNVTETSCQTQAAIDTKYANWLATVSTSGGCNSSLTNNSSGAPSACGGSKTVVFTVTSSCQADVTCSASFTVTAAPTVSLTCPLDVTETSCQTQAAIDTKYANWLATVTTSGGCNSSLTNNSTGAPSACGGSKTVVFTVTSSCQADVTCSASFTVTAAPAVSLTCPLNVTETSCQTQAAIDTKYTNWLATVTTSGGCNSSLTNNSTGAPSACGGSKTVLFTVTSSCQSDVTCSASFTVTSSPSVSLSCPMNVIEAPCQGQAVLDAKFAAWLASATASGGCNGLLTNNNTGAPDHCFGGTTTVTFTYTNSCSATQTCSALFIVTTGAPDWTLTKTSTTNPNHYDAVGNVLTYSIVVDNTGNLPISNVVVTDPQANPGSIQHISGDNNLNSILDQTETWNYIAAHTVTQADLDAGEFINTATATGIPPGMILLPVGDTARVPAIQNKSINLLKNGTLDMNAVAPNGIANVGDKIHYTFTVTNTGNITLNNVTITDPIVTVSGGPITLAPGATDNSTFTGVYTLTQADIDAGHKDNTATVIGKDPQNQDVTDTDDETTNIPGNPSIDLLKTGTLNMNVVSPNGIANVGDQINYSFTVTNTGNVTLSNILIADPIVTVMGGPITLAPGATNSIAFTGVYTLTQTDNDAGFKYNVATVNGKDPQNQTISDSDDETTSIPKSASISLVKTGTLNTNVIAPNGIANPGDQINYAFTVTNTGNVTLTNIVVTDPIVTVVGGPITLAPGASNSLAFMGVYTVTQADIDAGYKDNTATTTGRDPQNQIVTDSDDETTVIPKSASIDLVKTGTLNMNAVAPNGIANVGDQINYAFTVTNTGNVTLTNITITDPIVTVVGGPITLAPGASNSVTFTGVYTLTQADIDAGFKDNTATTTGKDPQNQNVSDWDDETTIIPKNASIDLLKTGTLNMNAVAPNGIANVGDQIHYAFTVTNTGNVTLTNIIINDPIVTVIGGPITLAPGASNSIAFTGVYTLTQTDIDAGYKDNTAVTIGKDPQNQDVSDWDDETTNIPKKPSIDLLKIGTLDMNFISPNGIANVGDKINYAFTVTNTGNVTLTNIVVTDPIVTVVGGPITLAPGASNSVAFTGVYTLTQADIDAGYKDNTALTTGRDPQNQIVTDSDDETTVIPKNASIDLVKTGTLDMNAVAPNGIANVGDQINYAFTVTNTGNVTLTNITVTDPIVTVIGGPITLAPGASNSLAFTGVYTLTQTDIDAGYKDNTATTTGRDPQNQNVSDTDDETTIIPKNASIDLVKTGTLNMNVIAPNGIANVGDQINYAFTVTNTGNVTLTNIVVTDPIVTVVGGPITLAPGASNGVAFTGVYTLTQADIDAGHKDNTATTIGKDPQNQNVTDWDDETTNIPKSPSIDLVKTGTLNTNVIAPNGIANAGDQIHYAFTVTNTGNVTLTNITVTDPIVTVVGGPISLAPGASNSIAFTGVYTLTQIDIDAGYKDNTATTTGKDPQNQDVSDTDDETTIIPKNASIDLLKTGTLDMNFISPNGIANVGDKINYAFTVTNTGNVTLTNIFVTDPIVSVIGGPITLAPGASNSVAFTGVYTLTQSDIDAGQKDNTATTTGEDPQNQSVSDTDDETTWIPKNASIDLVKTGALNMNFIAPNGIANVGDQINYAFTVTNTGNVTLTNITVTDPIVTVIGGPITLAPGASNSIAFTGVYTLTQADIDTGYKDNTATTVGKDPQNQNVTDWDDERTNIPQSPKITLEKSGTWNDTNSDGYANVGEPISYNFKVCNTGNVTLTNVLVSDPLVTILGGPVPVLTVGACNSIAFTGMYAITQTDIDTGRVINVATTTGTDPKGNPVTDTSDDPGDWTNDDPDTDGDPDDPTITDLIQHPRIGVAKKCLGVVDNHNGTYTSKFEIKVRNIGNITLGDIQLKDNLTAEFGNYLPPIPLNPGDYAVQNLMMVMNSMNPVALNPAFNGQSVLNLLNVNSGGTLKVNELIKISFEVVFKPSKYVYHNQAIAFGDVPGNDDSTSSPDDDPDDAMDLSDGGINDTDDPNTGGNNSGEPGDQGTVDDPTFIEIPAGQLKGIVWDDINGNGLQDSGEPGMIGVEAWLYSCDGTLIKKDTTDSAGGYLFNYLETPLDYYVVFKPGSYIPVYAFTFPNIGGNDNLDNDANAMGVGHCTTLDLYEKDSTYDAGLVRLASTGNFVWNDMNGNGIQDVGEQGIFNVKVTIYDAVTNVALKNTYTDLNGNYLLNDLMPGNYYLKYEAPSNWTATASNATVDFEDSDVDNTHGPGTTANIYLGAGEVDLSMDAGFYDCAKITGYVWYDEDYDGIFDIEEKGINGLKVFIVDANSGNTVATLLTTTRPGTASDDGYFKSNCLNPGNYYIQFERPGHLGASPPYKGTNPNKDCDITHENGINTTRIVTLSGGELLNNLAGGFQTKSLVGDKVWIDQNFNGMQDYGELPLPGVKVAAYNMHKKKVSESLTGADGLFILDGMTQGDFYLKFEVPNSKYGFTKAHAGIDDMDSDVDGSYGYGSTKMFSILPGEVRPTLDAGVVSQALAMEWLQFNGTYNGKFTELNWSTAFVEDNDHFVVERKHELDHQFEDIGNVQTNSTPNLKKYEYEFDDLAVEKSGTYYYRLKQVSKDGTFTFSKIISVHVELGIEELSVTLFPNPVNDILHVELWIPLDTELEMIVFENNGKLVKASTPNQYVSKGKYNELLNTSQLDAGQYILQIKTSNGVVYRKFTVLR